ncbi:MAG: 30S ribosomal protein S16 [Bacteroidota bacterium]
MSVKLRLQRGGRKHRPYYWIVAADSRMPRDGRFLEKIGHYNPMRDPADVSLDHALALKWLKQGAQPSDTVRSILSKEGVMLKLHLIRKGKSLEEIEAEYNRWRAKRDEIEKREEEARQAKRSEADKKQMDAEKKRREAIAERVAAKNAPPAEEKAEGEAAEAEAAAEEAPVAEATEEAPEAKAEAASEEAAEEKSE